jgi:hypothetical protein
MSVETLVQLGKDFPQIDKAISDLEELIKFKSEVGESVVADNTNLAALKNKRAKWYVALKARGYVK